MGKPTGFLEYNRETAKVLPPKVRIANFKEFRTPLNKEKGCIDERDILGKVLVCFLPFSDFGVVK